MQITPFREIFFFFEDEDQWTPAKVDPGEQKPFKEGSQEANNWFNALYKFQISKIWI